MRSAFISQSTSDDRDVAEIESFLRAASFEEVFNTKRCDEDLADAKAALNDAGLG